jgi:hypothetical protein
MNNDIKLFRLLLFHFNKGSLNTLIHALDKKYRHRHKNKMSRNVKKEKKRKD